MYPITTDTQNMEFFPTPMITDELLSNKRRIETTQDEQDEQDEGEIKSFRISPVPMDIDEIIMDSMDLDIIVREPFVFLPIPQLIRSDRHIN